uniref:Uncharacterized protein n=1 Tax=Arundo donax TaxID=35708 RepID=A0A0A8Y5K9_ARUDO
MPSPRPAHGLRAPTTRRFASECPVTFAGARRTRHQEMFSSSELGLRMKMTNETSPFVTYGATK